MSVAVSNSPVFSSPHHHNHHSIFTSSLSPRPRSPLPCSPFKQTFDGPSTSGSPPPGTAAALLKRKRPTRLDIPILSVAFGAPATPMAMAVGQEAVVEEERDGFYSVVCKKGRRASLEDRFSALLDIHGHPQTALFGVFDGHGGSMAAEYAAENLSKNIVAEVLKLRGENNIEKAVELGYLKTDSDFLQGDVRGGSCCVTALITEGDLVVSNAGDCRAVISRAGVAQALTSDHRPSRQDEKDRIEANGGYIDCFNGVWRIQGSLAVSRGIGDEQLKQWVISEPETRVVKISHADEFLILASDGLWDKVSNQEAVDSVRPLFIDCGKPEPLAACKRLVDMAVSRGSLDDVSVMVIQLEQYIQ